MDWLDLTKGIAMALVPPHDAEGGSIYKWRLAVAGVIGGLTVAVVVHIAWACGFFAPFGLMGFARADVVNDISARLGDIQVGQIRAEILVTRTSQCKAMKNQNQDALTIITRDLQDALDQYQKLSKLRYQLPTCDAL